MLSGPPKEDVQEILFDPKLRRRTPCTFLVVYGAGKSVKIMLAKAAKKAYGHGDRLGDRHAPHVVAIVMATITSTVMAMSMLTARLHPVPSPNQLVSKFAPVGASHLFTWESEFLSPGPDTWPPPLRAEDSFHELGNIQSPLLVTLV